MNLRNLFIGSIISLGVTLASLACAQEKPAGELVVNPGFEQIEVGVPAAWSGIPFIAASSPNAQAGARSLKIETPDEKAETIVTQNITNFDAAKRYRLQYDVRSDRFGIGYRVYVGQWKDAQPGDPADTPVSVWVGGADTAFRQGNVTWQHITTDFTPAPTSNKWIVVLEKQTPGAVWFDNVSITPAPSEGDAAPANEPAVVELPPAASPASAVVTFTTDRRFRVKGKPFFPLMIWGWTPKAEEAFEQAHDWGFNIVGTPLDEPHRLSSLGPFGAKLLLDAAERRKMQIMVTAAFNFEAAGAAEAFQVRTKAMEPLMPLLRDHPATFGYTISDEPAWAGHDVKTFAEGARWLRTQDPRHPIYVNHAPRNSIQELKRYNVSVDIAGSDIYPVVTGPLLSSAQTHSDLPNKTLAVVGDETRKNLEAVDFKKPVMQTLQGFRWNGIHAFPSRRQSRFMAWDSVIAGATGITWFQNGVGQLAPELRPVVREFAALQDVLAGGTLIDSKVVFETPIKTIAYKWKGSTILMAINVTDKVVQAKASWKPLFANRPLRVLWEERTVSKPLENFQPFDVHVYTDAPKDTDILRAGYEIENIDS